MYQALVLLVAVLQVYLCDLPLSATDMLGLVSSLLREPVSSQWQLYS